MVEGLVSARVKYWPDKDIEIYDDGFYKSFVFLAGSDSISASNQPTSLTYKNLFRSVHDVFTQSNDFIVTANTQITMSVSPVYGNDTYTYQWYRKGPNDTYISAISGATADSYTYTVQAADDQLQFYCRATGTSPQAYTCKPITIHII